MDAADQIANHRLRQPDAAGKIKLRSVRPLQVVGERFHWFRHMSPESIGTTYYCSIGRPDSCFTYAPYMTKPESSFYDRAMEVLVERYGKKKATQARLASLAGVAQPSVNEWREGFPKMDTGVRLARNLRCCVEWLYTERGPKYPPEPTAVPLGSVWGDLDESEREEVKRFADFVRSEKPK